MLKTNTKQSTKQSNKKSIYCRNEVKSSALTNSTFELVSWLPSHNEKVLALQTTRLPPQVISESVLSKSVENTTKLSHFNSFNLGLHVGDDAKQVVKNREYLRCHISNELVNTSSVSEPLQSINIQWLDQVHSDKVVEIDNVSNQAITADASITREKNIALAIMTADCLPILLSNHKGNEIAAIHAGWRSLSKNIIDKCINKMHSEPVDIIAWLGPCIGPESFEVGGEVREVFIKQNKLFTTAFVKQANGKYLADLHLIAKTQLIALGVTTISSLAECTYLKTDKYYSYRKENITGRMASIICRR